MGSIKVVGITILVLLSSTVTVPSSAQDATCWVNIAPCFETAKAQNYAEAAVQPCCPDLSDAITNDKSCFCLGQADLVSQGADAIAIFNGILGTCSISGTMDSICSASSTPSGTASPPTQTASTPSETESTPTASPPAPSIDVQSPSGDASGPSSDGPTPSEAPSMAADSTSSATISHKSATTLIPSLFIILMSFTIYMRA